MDGDGLDPHGRKAYRSPRGSLWKNPRVLATFQPLAPLFALALAVASGVEPPPTARPDLASGLESGRKGLARYQWRLRTEMKVDGVSRLTKLEDVHLGPDGGLVTKKTVKYDRRPEPTPYPRNDPRADQQRPLTQVEEERLAEAGASRDEGAVARRVFLAPVEDLEVGRAELGQAPGVRGEVVEDDRGDAEVGADLLGVDGEGHVRPLGTAVPYGAGDAEGGRFEPFLAREEAVEGVVEGREVARREARAALLDEAPVLHLEEGEAHVRSADVSGEQHRQSSPAAARSRKKSLHGVRPQL